MKKRIFFSYIQSPTFSGQSAASDLIITTLSARNWNCVFVPLYALNRSISSKLKRYLLFIYQQLRSIVRLSPLIVTRSPVLHISLGQSYGSFFRVGVWFFPLKFIRRSMKVVISLNGSVFTEWKKGSRLLSIFLKFINRADVVTVVGAKHRQTLLQFGVAPNKVIVVGNPCTLPIIESEEVTAKQLKAAPGQTINLLHLSLLIESKGFPEYLEALEILAERQMDTRINAVLCGPLSFTAYCTRFTSVESKRKWIVSKVESINLKGNGKVRVDWIEGARGEMKQKLFRDAHIFILPTYFPVEAQPLVLLEALASGAAVITSTAGEIPSTLNNASATMLSDLSPAAIANEIVRLTEDTQARLKMALTGNELVRSAFSLEHYATTWENIFNKLTEPKK